MPSVRIKLNGRTVLKAQITQRIAVFKQKVGNAIQGAGIDTQADAKQLCPVGTPESTHKKGYRGGRLRASIQYVKITELSCKIGTDVYYAWFVELGTYKMYATPFLFPAYIVNKRALLIELKSIAI